ncbi:hypothetical protein L1987_32403 [Smallanthus sonchifolius]|uniref:Uncharacterized protein n=1 Tax=Smallanthus sonchifolius TaxID=185202 RepID=A0ACB9HPV7_9ASTR|nr:hypothetical protein L1987_32403 [Smallanthus sonchifolius]
MSTKTNIAMVTRIANRAVTLVASVRALNISRLLPSCHCGYLDLKSSLGCLFAALAGRALSRAPFLVLRRSLSEGMAAGCVGEVPDKGLLMGVVQMLRVSGRCS